MISEAFSTPARIRTALYELTNDSSRSKYGGSLLYRYYNRNYVYSGESHSCYIGVSGCGKSRRGTIPLGRTLIDAGENLLAADPKGELRDALADYARRKGYTVRVIDFRAVNRSTRYNPLALPTKLYRSGDPKQKEAAIEMLGSMAKSLFSGINKENFWNYSAESLFIGIVTALLEYAEPEQVNLANVYKFLMDSEDRIGGCSSISGFLECLPADSPIRMQLHSYVSTAYDTRGGIRASMLEGLSAFSRSKALIDMLSYDELDIAGMDLTGKLAVFVVVPDETPIFNRICGVLTDQMLCYFIRLAHERFGGRLPIRMNCILEELGNICGAMPSLPHRVSAARSRNIRIQYVLQSFSQLRQIYSAADADTIIGNTDVIVAFRTNNWDTMTELSRKCGEQIIYFGDSSERCPLITPCRLAAMQTGQMLVMISGAVKYICELPDYSQMFEDTASAPSAPESVRIPCEISFFDLKRFVKETKIKIKEDSRSLTPRTLSDSGSDNEKQQESMSMPSGNPPADLDFDALLADIDRRIAETESKQQAPARKKLVLLVKGYKGDRESFVNLVAATARISIAAAKRRVDDMPFILSFRSEKARHTALIALSEGGAEVEIL